MATHTLPEYVNNAIQLAGYSRSEMSGNLYAQFTDSTFQQYHYRENTLNVEQVQFRLTSTEFTNFMDWWRNTIKEVEWFNYKLPGESYYVEARIIGNIESIAFEDHIGSLVRCVTTIEWKDDVRFEFLPSSVRDIRAPANQLVIGRARILKDVNIGDIEFFIDDESENHFEINKTTGEITSKDILTRNQVYPLEVGATESNGRVRMTGIQVTAGNSVGRYSFRTTSNVRFVDPTDTTADPAVVDRTTLQYNAGDYIKFRIRDARDRIDISFTSVAKAASSPSTWGGQEITSQTSLDLPAEYGGSVFSRARDLITVKHLPAGEENLKNRASIRTMLGRSTRFDDIAANYRRVEIPFAYKNDGTTIALRSENSSNFRQHNLPTGVRTQIERMSEGLVDTDSIGDVDYAIIGTNLYVWDALIRGWTRVGTAAAFGIGEASPQGLAAIGNTLYAVGSNRGYLFTIDTTTGIGTRVGTAAAFGIGEYIPTGLAAIGNTLYAVGSNGRYLFTIDTTTGIGTRVGTATNFGIGEGYRSGLAAIGNTLYAIGTSGSYLFTIDTTTGIGTRIGTATQFGIGETAPSGLAAIGNTLCGISSGASYLFTIDTNTGVGTRVERNPPAAFNLFEDRPSGLAAIGNTLYAVGGIGFGDDPDRITAYLFTIDTTTGVGTRVGSADQFGIGEYSPQGLAAIGNTLYAIGSDGGYLFTIDTTTGIGTRVGTAEQFGIGETAPTGLAAIGNTLYAVGSNRGYLFTIDTTTGIGTRVGTAEQFGIGEYIPTGLAAIGNTLYAVGSNGRYLFTIVTTTGVGNRIGTAVQFGIGETAPSGLAAIGNTLYAVGSNRDYLFTIDTQTGIGTRVEETPAPGKHTLTITPTAVMAQYQEGTSTNAYGQFITPVGSNYPHFGGPSGGRTHIEIWVAAAAFATNSGWEGEITDFQVTTGSDRRVEISMN